MYTFSQIADLVELPGAFMIGAGAGPHRHIGCCCEVSYFWNYKNQASFCGLLLYMFQKFIH